MAPDQIEQPKQEEPSKLAWEEPKLAFVEPTLTHHGKVQDISAGFFGSFTP